MKIYRVKVNDSKSVLWPTFQSAAQSHAYWQRRHPDAELLTAHVPDDAWKPVDKRTETRLSQVQYLWEQLVQSDPQGLDALLDELVKRVNPPAKATTPPPATLSEKERTEAMRALDQLVA